MVSVTGFGEEQIGEAVRAALLADEAVMAAVEVSGGGGAVKLTVADPEAEYLPYFGFGVDAAPESGLTWYPDVFGSHENPSPEVEGTPASSLGQKCVVGDQDKNKLAYICVQLSPVRWIPDGPFAESGAAPGTYVKLTFDGDALGYEPYPLT